MVSPIRSAGLASGLPVNDIIEQLRSVSEVPIERIENKKKLNEAKQEALKFISVQTLQLSISSFNLTKDSTFNKKSTSSTNESALQASAGANVSAGTYTFKVGQIAQASQVISAGVQDKSSTKIGEGTITINQGTPTLNQSSLLSALNGGKGVEHGSFRITDNSGSSEIIDISTALTIDDVIKKVNSSELLDVQAKISDDGERIIIQNNTGKGDITITDTNGSQTAKSLGIRGTSSKGSIESHDLMYLTESTALTDTNDNLGVDITGAGITDLVINRLEGNKEVESINVDLNGSKTIGDVLDKINEAVGEDNFAYIEEGENGISFKEKNYKVINSSQTNAASQLGLVRLDGGTGKAIAGLNDSLLRNLNGSSGISEGEIILSEKDLSNNGNPKEQKIRVDSSGSLRDFLNQINSQKKIKMEASINDAGNGIQLTSTNDNSTTKISVSNGDGFNSATELGIEGSSTSGSIIGKNIHRKSISKNTYINTLNNGEGIGDGKIQIELSSGAKRTINVENENIKTVNDLMIQIQGQFNRSSELSVNINKNGDGLLIQDLTDGNNSFRISDLKDGKVAKNLNINQISNSKKIDGTSEFILNVSENQTLEDITAEINKNERLGVNASIIDDGTGRNSFRLNLVSKETGANSNIHVDSRISNFDFSTTAEGLDSVVSYGSTQGGGTPLILTSNNLKLENVVGGLELDLKGTSETEINITVNRDVEGVKEEIKGFVETYNEIIKNIKNLTKFVPPEDSEDLINTGTEDDEDKDTIDAASGLLLGNSTLRRLQADLFNMVASNVEGTSGNIKNLNQVGLELDSQGVLNFNEAEFDSVLSSNPEDLIDLFTLNKNIIDRNSEKVNVTFGGGLTGDSSFNSQNLLDGITSSSSYNDDGGNIGTKFSGTGFIDFNLGAQKDIKKLVLNQINNLEFPADEFGLQHFSLQYKNSVGEFLDINEFFHNNDGRNAFTLPNLINTDTIRLNVLDKNPDTFRLLGLEAYEPKGSAFILNDKLKSITNADSGTLTANINLFQTKNDEFDEQISKIQEKVDRESDRLVKSFTAMEQTISNLNNQSSILSSSLSNLPSK